jgi:hypothetical protein
VRCHDDIAEAFGVPRRAVSNPCEEMVRAMAGDWAEAQQQATEHAWRARTTFAAFNPESGATRLLPVATAPTPLLVTASAEETCSLFLAHLAELRGADLIAACREAGLLLPPPPPPGGAEAAEEAEQLAEEEAATEPLAAAVVGEGAAGEFFLQQEEEEGEEEEAEVATAAGHVVAEEDASLEKEEQQAAAAAAAARRAEEEEEELRTALTAYWRGRSWFAHSSRTQREGGDGLQRDGAAEAAEAEAAAVSRCLGFTEAPCLSDRRCCVHGASVHHVQEPVKLVRNGCMGDRGALSYAAGLRRMATMQPPRGRAIPIAELHLMQNWIGGEGAAAICAACQEMASLQLLDLSKNRIGQAGADAVAALLQAQTGLRVLRLGNCELGDRASAGERPFPHFVRPF